MFAKTYYNLQSLFPQRLHDIILLQSKCFEVLLHINMYNVLVVPVSTELANNFEQRTCCLIFSYQTPIMYESHAIKNYLLDAIVITTLLLFNQECMFDIWSAGKQVYSGYRT